MKDIEIIKEHLKREIRLFAGVAPGSEGVELEEEVLEIPAEGGASKVAIQKTLVPTIIPFIPKECNGTAVLVIPGGAFRREVFDSEGVQVAEWLNKQGVAAFVLKHRMPCDPHVPMENVPLMDGQRAIRIIRSRAAEWGIEKVGVMGFSAGGHLASLLATRFDKDVYPFSEEMDKLSARPDFAVLCYPAINGEVDLKTFANVDLTKLAHTTKSRLEYIMHNSTDTFVRPDMPPVFIVETDEDKVTPAEHSLAFYMAARKVQVPAELHIFKTGKHGAGLYTSGEQAFIWPQLFLNWLKEVF